MKNIGLTLAAIVLTSLAGCDNVKTSTANAKPVPVVAYMLEDKQQSIDSKIEKVNQFGVQEPNTREFYTVQNGDNLYRIASLYKVTIKDLLSVNPEIKNENLIKAGQQLVIPQKEYASQSKAALEPVKIEASKQFQVGNKIYSFNSQEEMAKTSHLVNAAFDTFKNYQNLPYVWGGESPFSLEETIKNPLTKEVSPTKLQPPGNWRSGKPTEPGFDCSGAVWFIYQAAGLDMDRTTAAGYKSKGREVLAMSELKPEIITENAAPGDLIIMDGHIVFYLGGGMILESSGTKKPDYKNILQKEWNAWRDTYLPSQDREDKHRGGLQINPVEKYAGRMATVRRIIDASPLYIKSTTSDSLAYAGK